MMLSDMDGNAPHPLPPLHKMERGEEIRILAYN
jgi:hypothetical protein